LIDVISSLTKLKFFILLLGIGAACFFLSREAPAQASLVSTNETWRYLDAGVDMGIYSWRSPSFNEDYRWQTGVPPLGYGVTPEGQPVATTVSYGPDPKNKYITTYFRHAFVVTNVAAISNLTLTLESLDGGVIYLNSF